MGKDIDRPHGKNTHVSSMGHQAPPEDQWLPKSEEPYAGPKRSTRGPRTDRPVAVIGASADRSKFGNKAVRAYSGDGYTVWPVNTKGDRIEGVDTFRSLAELPGMPFLVSIYLHEDAALQVLDELADMQNDTEDKVAVIYLNPGSDTARVIDRARELGMFAIQTCSIQAIGHDPREYPDE